MREGTKYHFPGALPGRPDDADGSEDAGDDEFVRLCALPIDESESTVARLESERISCHASPCGDTGSSPSQSLMEIRVPSELFELAEHALARASDVEEPENPADEQALRQSRVDRWICPQCVKRTLDLLPAAAPWLWARLLFLAPLAALTLLHVLAWALPINALTAAVERLPDWTTATVFAAFAGFIVSFALAPVRKRCTECGWRPGDPPSPSWNGAKNRKRDDVVAWRLMRKAHADVRPKSRARARERTANERR